MARRRDPFKDIEELFDRLNTGFGDLGRELETGLGSADSILVDVADHDDHVDVVADLPGYGKSDIDVSVRGRQLRISAEHTDETQTDEATYHRRERSHRSVSRTVSLPTDVVEDEAAAHYENGVLTITLPKRQSGDDGTDISVS